jgi:hypothetical protein
MLGVMIWGVGGCVQDGLSLFGLLGIGAPDGV